jgi:hypothetical protein
MERSRWTTLCLALLLAGLLALGSPLIAVAAEHAQASAAQQDPNVPDRPDRNIISVPGVFSLWLGQGLSTRNGVLVLDGAQVDLPAINATATVEGFTFNLRDSSYGWDAIVVTQAGPRESDALTIADTQVRVQGPATNFSTDASTRIELHPSPEVQAGATVDFTYDGLTSQAGLAVADGNVQVAAGPATVTVEGLNAGGGAFTVDAAQVMFPDAETGVRVDGFALVDGSPSWQALAWYGREFNLGNVVTLSDNLVVIPGPVAGDTRAGGATTTFVVNVGELGQTGGQLVIATDPATGQPAVTLRNGNATLGAAGWSIAAGGINVGPSGATVDTVTLIVEPLGMQAQITGLEVAESAGASFDQARILYLPNQNGAARTVGGFELVISSTQAGYVVTTTTLLPAATVSQP